MGGTSSSIFALSGDLASSRPLRMLSTAYLCCNQDHLPVRSLTTTSHAALLYPSLHCTTKQPCHLLSLNQYFSAYSLQRRPHLPGLCQFLWEELFCPLFQEATSCCYTIFTIIAVAIIVVIVKLVIVSVPVFIELSFQK